MIYCYLLSLPTALTPSSGLANNIRGVSTVHVTTGMVEKKGFTIALCISISGEKLPAFLRSKVGSSGSES